MNYLLKGSLLTLLLGGLMLVASSTARADTVTFSTAGVFTCGGCGGSGSSSVTFNGSPGNTLQLSFTGVNTTLVANPSSVTSFGTFTSTAVGTGGVNASGSFTLTITQTQPGSGSDTFTASVSGTFTVNSSSGLVTFSVLSKTINGVTYTLQQPPGGYFVGANQSTTVQGLVSVPEPTSMLLLGTGLVGAVGVIRRRIGSRSTEE